MILDLESWMNIRRFRVLQAAGATFAEIGRECGCDWRTVRKYLAEDAASVPPAAPPRKGTQPLLITPFIPLVVHSAGGGVAARRHRLEGDGDP
jgi:predicted transcriptional regulator